MRVFLTGGTGLIGRALIYQLHQQGWQISALTRHKKEAQEKMPFVQWVDNLADIPHFDGFDAVIHLAGAPIFAQRWTALRKETLRQSRLHLTAQLVQRINQSQVAPKVFISASATGFYGSQEGILKEDSPKGQGFTADLCQEWEQIARQAKTRFCLLRTGMVLSPKGGALAKMLPLYRLGFGGHLGSGLQYWAWISLTDMLNGILFLLQNPTSQGAYNLVAPTPVLQRDFNQLLAKKCHRPAFFHTPKWLLTCLLGERAELLLANQNIIPAKLLKEGFRFQHPTLKAYFAKENLSE